MAERTRQSMLPDEAKLGAVVLLAILVFVTGLFFLKDVRVTSNTFLVKVVFKNISGVKRSDPVQISGVRVGKVERIGLEGQQPVVYLRLDDGARIPNDSMVEIKDRSVMGEKVLEIYRGRSSDLVQEGDALNGQSGTGLNTILSSADSLSGDVRTLIANLNTFIDPRAETSIKRSLTNVQELTDVLNKALHQDSQQVHQIVTNMGTISSTLQDLSASERGKISATMSNLEKSSAELRDVTARLQRLTSLLEAILQHVERGEGTLGKLVNDDKLYTDLNKLVVNLDGLVSDVKKNPKRYLGISIF